MRHKSASRINRRKKFLHCLATDYLSRKLLRNGNAKHVLNCTVQVRYGVECLVGWKSARRCQTSLCHAGFPSALSLSLSLVSESFRREKKLRKEKIRTARSFSLDCVVEVSGRENWKRSLSSRGLQGPTNNSASSISLWNNNLLALWLPCEGSENIPPFRGLRKNREACAECEVRERREPTVRAENMQLHNFQCDERVTTWHNAQDTLADG